MALIWDTEKKEMIKVRSLKNFKVPHLPDLDFFVHKSYKRDGFTATERSTGSSVVAGKTSKVEAELQARERLNTVTPKKMQEMINAALKEQRR
jgi:hypothetical protein